MRKTCLDESLAFTALLDMYPGFGPMPVAEGAKLREALLADWYAQEKVRSMWAFAKAWIADRTDPRTSARKRSDESLAQALELFGGHG
jgi:hypothetical protein